MTDVIAEDLPPISHIWSSFGHRFASADSEDSDVCLTCGAVYRLARRDDDPTGGDYQAANGDDPAECTGRTDLWHGEQPCQHDNGTACAKGQWEPCEHLATEHGCNCLQCA